ncbi:MAG: type II toxin-antitoxin system VapC family toxin [Sulfuritalea sp.]|jgi:predicted nucleic acid-binding protein|nr:type II toxin-antitoxin system VapC family toxin [Sulfuritalea sp.]MDP1981287.1 type II toxin-antitoxin system VapC family toxin [Sulfuritalea sp.]
MAVYLDTSTLVPLFFNEPASVPALARIAGERDIWLSRWTLAEFSSATAFKIRSRQTSEATAETALALLRTKLSRGDFCLTELERADLDEASRLCQAHRCGLRTPDALHAAIALRLRLPLLTCDKGQADGCGYHAIRHEYIVTP